MKLHLSANLCRHLSRFNLPGAILVALLQRTPALNLVATVDELVVSSPVGAVLKSVVATVAALGAVNSLAGATPLVPTAGMPTGITVAGGAPVSVFYTVSGVLTPPMSWSIMGQFPPGLDFSGLTGTGSVDVGPLHLEGTPTAAGMFMLTLQTFQFTGDGGIASPLYSYVITVTGPAATAPAFTTQPAGQTMTSGGSTSFTVAASGTPAPTFQWQVSTDGGTTWTNLANAAPYGGTATGTLAVTGATTSLNGDQFRCVATNSAGSVNSNAATLTVNLSDQVFLQQLCQAVLGRPIDSGALSSFSTALAGGESRAAALGGLLSSAEYGAWQVEPVIRLYYAALARPPDYAGLQNWSDALHAGALTLAGAGDQFAASPEFMLDYGALDNTGYVQQLYHNVLGRAADAPGLANWVGQLTAGASRGAVLIGFSESAEFQANMENQVEIIRLYYLLLKRMPTTAELQSWEGFLHGYDQTDVLFARGYPAGLADSAYVSLVFQGFLRRPADAGALSTFGAALTAGTVSHSSLVYTLLTSTEFATYVGPVSRLYMAAFRRVPDAAGLDNWVTYVRAGNSLQSAADAFVASLEFTTLYGALDDSHYVSLLYVNVLGRQADPAGLAGWVAQLTAGASRGQVLLGFSESQEGIGLFAPTVRTFLHYFTFLNAAPAQADLDFWNNYLATIDDQFRNDLLVNPAFTNGK